MGGREGRKAEGMAREEEKGCGGDGCDEGRERQRGKVVKVEREKWLSGFGKWDMI